VLRSATRRLGAVVLLVLGLGVFAGAGASGARADTPAHTDVMFVFDTTGSMGDALTEAKKEIQASMSQLTATLPDVRFGLAEVGDYGLVIDGLYGYGEGSGQAWTLKSPISSDQAGVLAQISGLFASGGGDNPEAYGRGLLETAINPAVGWRPEARGIIVLIADDVPHDNELNEGIPPEFWVKTPFDTGVDPGADNTVGTSDDIDWQGVLQQLNAASKPLEYVDYHGQDSYVPYWQFWSGVTGGSVISIKEGEEETLGSKLVEAVKSGATLPPCPAGQTHAENGSCIAIPPPPPPPTYNFKIEPRISCAKGCYVVEVKIVFDAAGNVISESVLGEEPGARSRILARASAQANTPSKACPKTKGKKGAKASGSAKAAKCKLPALIQRSEQAVVAGPNTVQLKLTGAAKKVLDSKGKVNLKVLFTYTPTGGTAMTSVKSFTVKKPVKKAVKKAGKGKS
jgi:hypothetical protein